jgi:hypothetical protein
MRLSRTEKLGFSQAIRLFRVQEEFMELKKRSFKEFFLISKRNNKRPNDRDQV